MKPFKVKAHINSLKGDYATVTIIDQKADYYIAEYNGIKCRAIIISNLTIYEYYVDDIYGIIKEEQ